MSTWHQVISFKSPKLDEDLPSLRRKLNAVMPPDVRIAHVQWVPPDFSARYSAIRKQYIFQLYTGPIMDPLRRAYALHVPYHLDVALMR